jgi:integrative and conjugative element protein (TIGR02256 family)
MRGRCWIDERAVRALLEEARRWRFKETGGALLGWRDGRNAVVAAVLGPGPNAKHGFRSFEPDGEWQVAEGRRIYRESGRRIAYIGDWHTHPFAVPRPSTQDRSAVLSIADDPDFRAPNPLSAIIGAGWIEWLRRSDVLMVYAWGGEHLHPMEIRPCRLDDSLLAGLS